LEGQKTRNLLVHAYIKQKEIKLFLKLRPMPRSTCGDLGNASPTLHSGKRGHPSTAIASLPDMLPMKGECEGAWYEVGPDWSTPLVIDATVGFAASQLQLKKTNRS
jgi:hypothetical protein